MATLRQMRVGLADALDTIGGMQASPYVLASPTLPAADVQPTSIQYHLAMGNGLEIHAFQVSVYVAAGLDEASQEKLDEFVDSGVVKAALEADKSLGGLVSDIQVTQMSDYVRVVVEGKETFSARWEVLIYD